MDIDLSSITNENFQNNEIVQENDIDGSDDEIQEEIIKPIKKIKQVRQPNVSNRELNKMTKMIKEKTEDNTLQDDKDKKLEVITILRLYLIKFKDDLKDYQKVKLDKLNLEKLIEMRNTFDSILGANTSIGNKNKIFYSAIYFVEKAVVNFNLLDVDGLTQVLYSNQDFQKDLMRLSLKYLTVSDAKPEVAVPLTIIQTMFELDRVNSLKKSQTIDNKDKSNKLDRINNEYNDL
jgi:hypothetical protein